MTKADKYLKETIEEILEDGQWDVNPRTKWSDGTTAHSKFTTQKVFQYDISKREFPINTLRPTALKGAWYDIEAIYLKQTNILEEMHLSIHSWWKDAVVGTKMKSFGSGIKYSKELVKLLKREFLKNDLSKDIEENDLGNTYGHTIRRYNLVDKLLKGLEENPFGRRHSINLNQEQQKIDDPKALQPCAFETLWSVRDVIYNTNRADCMVTRYIDLTLIQRSQDYITTVSINPAQYVMLGMIVANHLTFKTGIKHEVGKFLHLVQNVHIYDRHLNSAKEILERKETGLQPKIELTCEPKDFYEHTIEDFQFSGLEGIEKLSTKLEIAI